MSNSTCKNLKQICPALEHVSGYIIFGSLTNSQPYHHSYYINWRIGDGDYPDIENKSVEIERLIKQILKQYNYQQPSPHGYFKINSGKITFQLTTQDVVDTILDNIDKANSVRIS